jgi:hypothetical protein
MDAAPPKVAHRRGVIPAPRSGLNTAVFFGLIIFAVAAAGIIGVVYWGPEKTIKNRTQFATNPPAPMELPSLPPTAADPPSAASSSSATAEGAPAASAEEAAAPASAASASPKKTKRAPKAGPRKGR